MIFKLALRNDEPAMYRILCYLPRSFSNLGELSEDSDENLFFRYSTVGRRSFPVAASVLWNSLPLDIQSSPSLTVFRQRLKTFFIS